MSLFSLCLLLPLGVGVGLLCLVPMVFLAIPCRRGLCNFLTDNSILPVFLRVFDEMR